MSEWTGWRALNGRDIYDNDILESLVTRTPVKVLKHNGEWCIKNKLGKIVKFEELPRSQKNSNRLIFWNS